MTPFERKVLKGLLRQFDAAAQAVGREKRQRHQRTMASQRYVIIKRTLYNYLGLKP